MQYTSSYTMRVIRSYMTDVQCM